MQYNRYTPECLQENLSDQAKGEAVLLSENFDDMVYLISHAPELAQEVFDSRIEDNPTVRESKKRLLYRMIYGW